MTGEPNPDTLAYGWSKSVALAAWDRERALKNVKNYVSFAKAGFLRKLYPKWMFLYGHAMQERE